MSEVTEKSPLNRRHETVAIDSIAQHPDNANRGNVKKIMESIEQHGQTKDILVSHEGTIIAGNHTWEAMKELGFKEISIVRLEVDYTTGVNILQGDNYLSSLATQDAEQAIKNWRMLADTGNLAGTGADMDDVEDMIAEANLVAEMEPGGDTAEHAASEAEVAEGWSRPEGGGAPAQPMKELPFLFTPEAAEEFVKLVGKLKKRWGMGKASDVVLEAVKRAVDAEPDEAAPAPEAAPAAAEEPAQES